MGIINWLKDYWHDIKKSSGKTFKNVVLTAHFWVILIAVALMITSGILIFNTLNARRDQDLGKIWQNDGKTSFRQMSVFAQGNRKDIYAPLEAIDEKSLTWKSVMDNENGIRKKLQGTVDSGKTIVTKPGQQIKPRGWEDCFSTTFMTKGNITKEATINGEIKTADVEFESEVVAVGGNFAAFHPYEYMDGGFLPIDVKDPYQIVINDELAWKLYRSYSVVGEKIQVFGEDCTIVGVVREKRTSIDKISGASEPRLFCYFSTVRDLKEKGYFDAAAEADKDSKAAASYSDIAITCYEAFLPEVVKGVARSDMLAAMPSYNMQDPQYLITSNTGRFRVDKVYDFVMPLGEFQAKYSCYEFPYWERTAQLSTERLFVMEAVGVAGVILFIIGIIIAILRLRKPGGKFDTVEEDEPEEETNIAIQMT